MKGIVRYCLIIGMLVSCISCSENQMSVHKGKRLMTHQLSLVDSVMVDADATSGRGNFFMADSLSLNSPKFPYRVTKLFCRLLLHGSLSI